MNRKINIMPGGSGTKKQDNGNNTYALWIANLLLAMVFYLNGTFDSSGVCPPQNEYDSTEQSSCCAPAITYDKQDTSNSTPKRNANCENDKGVNENTRPR